MNTAELLVDRLIDWGVEVVFGLPGDGINAAHPRWINYSSMSRFTTNA